MIAAPEGLWLVLTLAGGTSYRTPLVGWNRDREPLTVDPVTGRLVEASRLLEELDGLRVRADIGEGAFEAPADSVYDERDWE